MVVMVVAGCADTEMPQPVAPDARVGACVVAPDENFDFYGEACISAPFPANTLCHDDDGWCIDGVCRPQCESGCPSCRAGEPTYALAGGCYCKP